MSDEQPASPAVPLPADIDGYKPQRILGSGGMATVYAARQQHPRRTVALKVMRPGIVTANTIRRFHKEINILARLRHPNIAQIYDAGTWDDGGGAVPYFVMEYVPGGLDIIEFAETRKLSTAARLRLFVKICSAVQHGHMSRVVHRDLKPANLLVDANGEPKVIDFGVARATERDPSGQTHVTVAGKLVGTVQYMSPEQVADQPSDIDARSDVYALGLVLYRLLCGEMPYTLAGLPLPIATRIIREDSPRAPSAANPEVRGDLETIVLTALEKDRSRRYASAGKLGREILRYLESRPIEARAAGPVRKLAAATKRRRGPLFAIGAAIITIGAIVAGGFGVLYALQQARESNAVETAAETEAARAAREEAARQRAESPARRLPFTLASVRQDVTLLFAGPGPQVGISTTEGGARIWNTAQREQLASLVNLPAAPSAAAVHPDGRLVALGFSSGDVVPYSLDGGRPGQAAVEHAGVVRSLAWSRDGRLASASDDITVRIWRPGQEETAVLRASGGAFSVVAWSEDGRHVVAGTDTGKAYVFDLDANARSRLDLGWEQPVHAAALSSGATIAAISNDHAVHVFDVATGERRSVSPFDAFVADLAFVDGERILAADDGGRLAVVDATTLEAETLHVPDHPDQVRAVRIDVQPDADGEPRVSLFIIDAAGLLRVVPVDLDPVGS